MLINFITVQWWVFFFHVWEQCGLEHMKAVWELASWLPEVRWNSYRIRCSQQVSSIEDVVPRWWLFGKD